MTEEMLLEAMEEAEKLEKLAEEAESSKDHASEVNEGSTEDHGHPEEAESSPFPVQDTEEVPVVDSHDNDAAGEDEASSDSGEAENVADDVTRDEDKAGDNEGGPDTQMENMAVSEREAEIPANVEDQPDMLGSAPPMPLAADVNTDANPADTTSADGANQDDAASHAEVPQLELEDDMHLTNEGAVGDAGDEEVPPQFGIECAGDIQVNNCY